MTLGELALWVGNLVGLLHALAIAALVAVLSGLRGSKERD